MRGRVRLAVGIVAALSALGAGSASVASPPPLPPPPGEPWALVPQVSSDGEQARHLCFQGGTQDASEIPGPFPCTAQYAPLMLSVSDRLDVRLAPAATSVALAASREGDSANRCRRSARDRWSCRLRGLSRQISQLWLSIRYPDGDGEVEMRWTFDAKLLPPGWRASDRDAGVRFRLAGRFLRASLFERLRSHPSSLRAELWGKQVKAVCRGRGGALRIKKLRWPGGWDAVTFALPRGLAQPRRCLLEDRTGGDIAVAARFAQAR